MKKHCKGVPDMPNPLPPPPRRTGLSSGNPMTICNQHQFMCNDWKVKRGGWTPTWAETPRAAAIKYAANKDLDEGDKVTVMHHGRYRIWVCRKYEAVLCLQK